MGVLVKKVAGAGCEVKSIYGGFSLSFTPTLHPPPSRGRKIGRRVFPGGGEVVGGPIKGVRSVRSVRLEVGKVEIVYQNHIKAKLIQ